MRIAFRLRTGWKAPICWGLAACWAWLCGVVSLQAAAIDVTTPVANDTPLLTAADVTGILQHGVAFLKSANASGLFCVTDREGHILALYRMTLSGGTDVRINEQASVKARTAAFFQSDQDAFTTRTAQFIVQSHFPPGITNLEGGPLFGVPFSSFPKSDGQLQQPPFIVFINGVNAPPGVPAGSLNFRPITQPLVITPITDDLGGAPLFKKVNGKFRALGAVGVEIDGFGVLANGVPDAGVQQLDPAATSRAKLEEQASLAAQIGFAPPRGIRGDKILVNGFRFPYVSTKTPRISAAAAAAVNLALEGAFEPFFDTNGTERDPDGLGVGLDPVVPYAVYNPQAVIVPGTSAAQPRGTPQQEFPKQGFLARFPARNTPIGDGSITIADVMQMVQQAADQAFRTRGAIRRPIGSPAAVFITIVDRLGNICGVFRTSDATIFSFDVAVQKARTSAFFSTDEVAFSTRAIGFLSQTLYPPGIDPNPPGALSGLLPRNPDLDVGALGGQPIGLEKGSGFLREISQLLTDSNQPFAPPSLSLAVQTLSRRLPHTRDGRLSPLQVAMTVDLTLGRPGEPGATTLPNGITIFPGGVPIYKNGKLVGAVGISGDGVDQDDVIAFHGAANFQPPDGVRCDQASGAAVVTALKSAVVKAKAQFPNLTSTVNDGVLDIISTQLDKGEGTVLQGLRLPYVKFPRSLGK